MRINLTCHTCGATFLKHRSSLRPNQRTFCSRACHVQGQRIDGLNAAGYRIIRANGQQVYEHRWLMEQHLGRRLLSTEHVHHLNGKKADNHLANLRLMDESDHHRSHVAPAFDIEHAKTLYTQGIGYRKLAALFGVARQNIRGCFMRRGWHIAGRTRRSVMH